jgi:hypothetical protein
MSQFKYLGITVTNQNLIQEEINAVYSKHLRQLLKIVSVGLRLHDVLTYFHFKAGGSKFLQNTGIFSQDYISPTSQEIRAITITEMKASKFTF